MTTMKKMADITLVDWLIIAVGAGVLMSMGSTVLSVFKQSQKNLTGIDADALDEDTGREKMRPQKKRKLTRAERRHLKREREEVERKARAGEKLYKTTVMFDVYVTANSEIGATNRVEALLGEMHTHIQHTHNGTAMLRNSEHGRIEVAEEEG